MVRTHPLTAESFLNLNSNREQGLSSAHLNSGQFYMATQKYCLWCACPLHSLPRCLEQRWENQRRKLSWDRALLPTECQGPFISRNVQGAAALPRSHRTRSRFSVTHQSNPQAVEMVQADLRVLHSPPNCAEWQNSLVLSASEWQIGYTHSLHQAVPWIWLETFSVNEYHSTFRESLTRKYTLLWQTTVH